MEYQEPLLGKSTYILGEVNSSFGSHFHIEMEVLYCKKGKLTVCVNNTMYYLSSGYAIFINAIEAHEIIIKNESPEVLVIEMGSTLLGDDFYQISKSKFLRPVIDLSTSSSGIPLDVLSRLKELFEMLDRERKLGISADRLMVKARLFELAAIVTKYFPLSTDTSVKRQRQMRNLLKIRKVFDLVANNYQQPIKLQNAADCTQYELKSFCRIFKETTNLTFSKYLNIYRIEVATRLLQSPTYNIGEIAQLVGFPVTKTFCRVFREVTGMTPTKYRKRL